MEELHLPKTCPTGYQWKPHKQGVLLCWHTVERNTALLEKGLSASPPSCAAVAAADLALTCKRQVVGCCSTPEQVGGELASEIAAAPIAAEA